MSQKLSKTTLLILISLSICCITSFGKKRKIKKLQIPKVAKSKQICFAMYTVNNNILKMTAQLYPLEKNDSRKIILQINENNKWKTVATSKIRENEYGSPKGAKAWNTLFRVENWDMSKNYKYRIVALDGIATYQGLIRKDPINKKEIVVAAFTGNSNRDRSPRTDIIKNIKYQDPDLLFFSGDQSYDHRQHLAAWLLFGRQFGEIIRNRPVVAIPDDHDVGQPNLWGAEGKKSTVYGASDGGYQMPPQYVREVEFAQTANLPDPYDPTPIKRGIGVYYTSLNIGGIDFAIIEDRKFKSGPKGLVPQMGPRPDHIRDPNYDPKTVDVPGAKLLGERQLKFLEEWGKDWHNAQMKSILSATIFCNAAHIHGNIKGRLHADMDSNGWPQTPRNNALKKIRKSFAFMIAGDQHLATIVHHGIDQFADAGYSFCVPSIINYYNRWWLPIKPPVHKIKTCLKYTGDYLDGFGNKITMYAYSNPGEHKKITHSKYVNRAAGYGIIRFNKETRKITMECWPRGVDLSKKNAKQYPGWPITIDQQDNYQRKAIAYLPTITVKGVKDPIFQVINQKTNETIYTIRIKGQTFTPKVFTTDKYTIIIGDQLQKTKTLKNIKPSKKAKTNHLNLTI